MILTQEAAGNRRVFARHVDVGEHRSEACCKGRCVGSRDEKIDIEDVAVDCGEQPLR